MIERWLNGKMVVFIILKYQIYLSTKNVFYIN